MGLCPVRVETPPRKSGLCSWMDREPNWTIYPVQTQTAGRLPWPVANSNLDAEQVYDTMVQKVSPQTIKSAVIV